MNTRPQDDCERPVSNRIVEADVETDVETDVGVDADGDDQLVPIGGQPPSMLNPPAGCAFHPRCAIARSESGCDSMMPTLFDETPAAIVSGTTGPAVDRSGHGAACWRRDESRALLGVVGA